MIDNIPEHCFAIVMQIQVQAKTANDYKDIIKVLKLKIIKQNRIINELQFKNTKLEEEINAATIQGIPLQENKGNTDIVKMNSPLDFDTVHLKGKAAVMHLFSKAAKKFGITLESIYRIADIAYKNEIEADYFRTVLSKLNLNLTPKQISCLVFIFDENCTGYITKLDYCNSLQAYQVASQESSLPYTQQCLLKLSHLFHQDRTNLPKLYEELQVRAKKNKKEQVDVDVFEEHLKGIYGAKIQEREIMGVFNEIDLESQGHIEKTNFLYCTTSFINRLLVEFQADKNQKSNMMPVPAKTFPEGDFRAINASLAKGFDSQLHQSQFQSPKRNELQTPSPQGSALERLEAQYGLKLREIYGEMLQLPFNKRVTVYQMRNTLQKLNPKLSGELISQFYKEIDSEQKGSIYLSELMGYYLQNAKDTSIIYQLLGKYFLHNDLSAQKFWFMFGFMEDSDISKDKFLEVMEKNFNTKKKENWEMVWQQFDKGKGVSNVGAIIKAMQKYEIV